MKQKDLKIDFRYLTGNIACLSVDSISGESVHNDINNEEAIIIFNSLVGEKADCQTVKSLLKENQELKKQVEDLELNWEIIKQYCLDEQIPEEYDEYNSYIEFSNSVYDDIFNKMENLELEQGSDSNDSN